MFFKLSNIDKIDNFIYSKIVVFAISFLKKILFLKKKLSI